MSSDDQTNYFKKFSPTTWIDSINQSKFFNSFETRSSFLEIDSFWLNSLSLFFFQNSCLSFEHFFFHFNETSSTKNRHQNNFIRWYHDKHEIYQDFTSEHEKKKYFEKKIKKIKKYHYKRRRFVIHQTKQNLSIFVWWAKISDFHWEKIHSFVSFFICVIKNVIIIFFFSRVDKNFSWWNAFDFFQK